MMIVAALAAVVLAGCNRKRKEEQKEPEQTTPEVASGAAGSAGSAAAGSAAAGSAEAGSAGSAAGSAAGVITVEGLQTPESVQYDPDEDLYLVSNINGAPTAVDGNGYISKVSPEGKIVDEKWIDGTKPGVKLDGPKGLALSGGELWVADITNVRRFDAKTGAPKGSIAIKGSTFLNDVAPDGKDGVFVSDTGVDAKFQPNGSDAVYHITKDGKLTTLIKNKDLGGPNGVWANPDGSVWVVTLRSGEIYQVDAKGKQGKAEKLPKGQLDGIVVLDNGDLLVSSWEAQGVYRGKPGSWTQIISGVQSPADIGFDSKRQKVLIPVFLGNQVQIHPLPQ